MKNILLVGLFGLFLFSNLHMTSQAESFADLRFQSGCIEHAVGLKQILADEIFDVNRDGLLDQVIVYGDDKLRLLVSINHALGGCEVVLDDYLISRELITGRQDVNVRKIELVELTNDNQPEIHVWLEESGGGGGPRDSSALHAIYLAEGNRWKAGLISVQCLAFNSFEFREISNGATQVYRDEDWHCQPPWSSYRQYELYQWRNSRFELVDSGTIVKRTTNPPIADLICIGPFVIGIVLIVVIAWLIIRLRHESTRL